MSVPPNASPCAGATVKPPCLKVHHHLPGSWRSGNRQGQMQRPIRASATSGPLSSISSGSLQVSRSVLRISQQRVVSCPPDGLNGVR